MSARTLLGITDYVLIVSSFAVCILIGLYSNRKRKQVKNGMSEFVLGSRKMPIFPVAISIAATFLSAVSVSGMPAEMYRYGLQLYFFFIGSFLTSIFLSYTVIPVFHRLPYVSIYEFLERRYDKTVRKILSGHQIAFSIIYLSVVLYTPSVSLAVVTRVPYWVIVLLGGIICTLYCVLGGFRAVIWTDVFQSTTMFASVLLVIIFGTNYVGGVKAVFQEAFNETNAEKINWFGSEKSRFSMLAVTGSAIISNLNNCVGNQAGAQRFLSVKNRTSAVQAYNIGACIILIFHGFLVMLSIVMLAAFYTCDPKQIQKQTGVTSDDQLFLYATSTFMGQYPGLQGLAMVALISATLSTISSYLNSNATIILEDFLKPSFPKYFSSEKKSMNVCKILTAALGLIVMVLSFLVPYLGGAMKVVMTFNQASHGPKVAVFIVGLFSVKPNAKACKWGYSISMLVVLSLAIVSMVNNTKYDTLAHNTKNCAFANESEFNSGLLNISLLTSVNQSFEFNTNTRSSSLNLTRVDKQELDESDVFVLPKISFYWFGVIGFTLTTILVFLFSRFMGGNVATTDPILLSSFSLWFSKTQSKTVKSDLCVENEEYIKLNQNMTSENKPC